MCIVILFRLTASPRLRPAQPVSLGQLPHPLHDLGAHPGRTEHDQLAAKVSITAVNDTQVMKITVQDADVNLAKDIVSNIVEQAPDVIINTVKAGSVEVVSDASANPNPVSPSKSRNTALAGMLGCVLVIGILFMKSLFNNRIMTESDISQKLALPILGVIPDSALGDNGSRKKKRRA